MQVFPREVTDYLAGQFLSYFTRRKERKKMSIRDARMLVDFVAGPGHKPMDSGGQDYRRPKVRGGGPTRPAEDSVRIMLGKYMDENAKAAEWDDVFDALLDKHKKDPEATKYILLVYRDGLGEIGVCDAMHISRPTYYKYRQAILSQAGVLAISKNLLKLC